MQKILVNIAAILFAMSAYACGSSSHQTQSEAETNAVCDTATVSKVYFIKDITPENLIKIYEALGREATGNVAVKLSTGESGNPHHLQPALIKPLIDKVGGTIVECNTAYVGKRNTTEAHLQTIKEHGFDKVAKVVLMDAEGEVRLPVDGGKHLQYDIVGKDYLDYDFTLVLSHFKGHPMAGFGGALKNISIGIASSNGKAWIHSAGKTASPDSVWSNLPEQDAFLESMAEASKAIIDHAGDNILYINVANNLSVDCDCVATPQSPQMADIGILASLDPVALDRASVDMVHKSTDHGKIHLEKRIEDRNGTHILDYAEQLGLGSQKYQLITLE